MLKPDENKISIRAIRQEDDPLLAHIIRDALLELGADRQGNAFGDPTTDMLYQYYQSPGSAYFVIEIKGHPMGGAGIHYLEGGSLDVCELQRMYLLKKARGKGMGKLLMERCLRFAKEQGFQKCYLETMPELRSALQLYEKFGFEYLDTPLGHTGHFDCNIWMLKRL